MHKSN